MPQQPISPLFKGMSMIKGMGVKGTSISTGMMLLLAGGGTLLPTQVAAMGTAEPLLMAQVPTSTPPADVARFSCQVVNGQYTVVYHPQSQPGQFYPWATPVALGGGWTPDLRCAEISRRLEEYRPDGLLSMQTGIENGYDIVCVTTQRDPRCRIVLTVPPGQDALVTRDRVFENLAVADSGQQTDAVTTFRGGDRGLLNQIGEAIGIDLSQVTRRRRSSVRSDSIDLRPFLDSADGGTGTQLRDSAPASSPQLNPDRFR